MRTRNIALAGAAFAVVGGAAFLGGGEFEKSKYAAIDELDSSEDQAGSKAYYAVRDRMVALVDDDIDSVAATQIGKGLDDAGFKLVVPPGDKMAITTMRGDNTSYTYSQSCHLPVVYKADDKPVMVQNWNESKLSPLFVCLTINTKPHIPFTVVFERKDRLLVKPESLPPQLQALQSDMQRVAHVKKEVELGIKHSLQGGLHKANALVRRY